MFSTDTILYSVVLGVGHKQSRENGLEPIRRNFSFSDFEDLSLAHNFAQQLESVLQESLLKNVKTHAVEGRLWKIFPTQVFCLLLPAEEMSTLQKRLVDSRMIPIIPTNNFDKVIREILKNFGISQEVSI